MKSWQLFNSSTYLYLNFIVFKTNFDYIWAVEKLNDLKIYLTIIIISEWR